MKGRLKFRRPFVVLDKKKTGGENFLQKVFSPRPPLSKTFDVIESLFIAFLILTASGSPPDFFVGKEMLILFARFLRIEAFTPFQSQTKRQDPSFSSGCHFEKTANRDSIRGKVLEGRGEGAWGRGEGNFLQKFSPSPDIPFTYFASSTRTGVSFSAGILTVGSRCSWLVSALAGLSAKWKGRKTVPGWRSVAVRRRATMEP